MPHPEGGSDQGHTQGGAPQQQPGGVGDQQGNYVPTTSEKTPTTPPPMPTKK